LPALKSLANIPGSVKKIKPAVNSIIRAEAIKANM